jgi:hydrogenase maturation protease
MRRTRVIGLGGRLAGDDAVGVAVIDHLRATGDIGSADLVVATEASAVIEAARDTDRLVVVDAALTSDPPGTVRAVAPEDLLDQARPLSSHGLALSDALALSALLWPDHQPQVTVLTISIRSAARGSAELSPEVEAAVPRAARCIQALLRSA